MKGVLVGFVLGVCAWNMSSMIQESNSHLKYTTQMYDLATEAMGIPHLIPSPLLALSCSNTTTVSTTSTTTIENTQNSHPTTITTKNNVKEASAFAATRVISNKNKIENKITLETDAAAGLRQSSLSRTGSPKVSIPYQYVHDFDPNLPAVLATKIHGPNNLPILQQAICLLHYAYNYKVNYDIVVFTSEPIDVASTAPNSLSPEEITAHIQEIRDLVEGSGATIQFVTDNPGLYEMVNELSDERRQHLLQRCHVNSVEELTWFTNCLEVCSTYNISERISYSWQAEFRSKHIWVHPSLAKYQYMLWFDADAFCTQSWQQDPIAAVVKHQLAILFDHFPQGHGRGHELPYRTKDAFGKVICNLDMTKNGTLFAKEGGCLGRDSRIKLIHGFLHVTNLNFYRTPEVIKWSNVLIGDTKFSRQYDDQIAVTIPAAVLAGDKSWDMRTHGINLQVTHNSCMDGQKKEKTGNYISWWKKNGEVSFPDAYTGIITHDITGIQRQQLQCKIVAGA